MADKKGFTQDNVPEEIKSKFPHIGKASVDFTS
jgi:hypothetical protein